MTFSSLLSPATTVIHVVHILASVLIGLKLLGLKLVILVLHLCLYGLPVKR